MAHLLCARKALAVNPGYLTLEQSLASGGVCRPSGGEHLLLVLAPALPAQDDPRCSGQAGEMHLSREPPAGPAPVVVPETTDASGPLLRWFDAWPWRGSRRRLPSRTHERRRRG